MCHIEDESKEEDNGDEGDNNGDEDNGEAGDNSK